MKEKYTPASAHSLERRDVCARKWEVKEGSHAAFYYCCLRQRDGRGTWHLNSGLSRRLGPWRSREGISAPFSQFELRASEKQQHHRNTVKGRCAGCVKGLHVKAAACPPARGSRGSINRKKSLFYFLIEPFRKVLSWLGWTEECRNTIIALLPYWNPFNCHTKGRKKPLLIKLSFFSCVECFWSTNSSCVPDVLALF